MDEKRTGLRRLLCRNCSRWAGENKYHNGPYGGTSDSNCPYDDKGRSRPGYGFIRAYYGTDVNLIDVESYLELDHEGCEYGEDHTVNTVRDTDSYNMTHIINSVGNIE